MARSYQPVLRTLLHKIAVYIARYRELLLAGLTPDQAAAVATFETALSQLQEQLGHPPPSP